MTNIVHLARSRRKPDTTITRFSSHGIHGLIYNLAYLKKLPPLVKVKPRKKAPRRRKPDPKAAVWYNCPKCTDDFTRSKAMGSPISVSMAQTYHVLGCQMEAV